MRTLELALITSLSCLPACRSSEPPARSTADASPESDSDSDADADLKNPFAGMANNPFAAMLARKLDEPGPYDAPKQSPNYEDDAPHLKVLHLKGAVTEVETIDPFALGASGGLQTRALLDKLDALAAEDHLDGLVLRVGDLAIDMARATQLRDGLLAFKAEGARTLHCHAEGLSNASLYLLSACDELSLAPVGAAIIPGPSATPIHLKGLLDRFGVVADVIHVGAFKGAAEPLTRDAPSPEMIETLEAVVDQAYATMVTAIAEGRGKGEDEVRGWIDEALFDAERAAERGLVDRVEAWEPALARVSGERGWKRVSLKTKPWSDPLRLQRFLGVAKPDKPSGPHVALVYAVGNIIDGKGRGFVGARSEIASAQLVPALDRLAEDEDVAAVVLRVDSGGGSARASEQIWHAVERLKTRKPVVVSMAGVAASGGYYISAGANRIFADTNTVTGSIGVVGGKIVLGPALERLGVKSYAVSKGARAQVFSPMQAWSEGEREAMGAMMEQTYEVFLARVAEGRGLERDAVHAIAQGRVWTGAAAKERGLVDELGGLERALGAAAELGGVGLEAGLEVYPGEPTIQDLLGSFDSLVLAEAQSRAELGGLAPGLELILDELGASAGPGQAWVAAVHGALRTLLTLRGAGIWAVEFNQGVRL